MKKFLAALAMYSLTACSGEIEAESSLPSNDPLYARVHSECASDSLILRVLESSEEAICCVEYVAFVPKLHCMTATGATVTNPENTSKLVEQAKAAKAK